MVITLKRPILVKRILILTSVKIGLTSNFKIYSTDPAILNDSDLSSKSNDNIENHLPCTQYNEALIKALNSKLLDKLMPHIKISQRDNSNLVSKKIIVT